VKKVPSLFDHEHGLLFEYYDKAEIGSDAARRRFVLPRRGS
jgi:hypothetical protein